MLNSLILELHELSEPCELNHDRCKIYYNARKIRQVELEEGRLKQRQLEQENFEQGQFEQEKLVQGKLEQGQPRFFKLFACFFCFIY